MQTWGRYTVFSCLERTHLTEVYDAYLPISSDLVRRVHIRKPTTVVEAPRALVQHARQAVQLSHSRISPILELSYSGEVPLLVSEGVPGRSLATLMAQSRGREVGLDLHAALAIGIQVLEGLGHAHQLTDPTGALLGLVHRDVHPESIWIGFDGAVRLGGFGFSIDPTMPRDPMPPLVNPLYWSPELATGAQVDHRSDIFSVGAIILQMLTGNTVWAGRTAEEQWTAARQAQVHLLSEVAPKLPAELQRTIDGALSQDPEERPPSAAVFRDELARILYRSEPAYSEGRLASVVAMVLGEAADDDKARAAAAFRHLSHLEPGLVIRPPDEEPSSPPAGASSVPAGPAIAAALVPPAMPTPILDSDMEEPTTTDNPIAEISEKPRTKASEKPSVEAPPPVEDDDDGQKTQDSFDSNKPGQAEPPEPPEPPADEASEPSEVEPSTQFMSTEAAPPAEPETPPPASAKPTPPLAPFTPPAIEAPDPAAAMADAFSAELSSDVRPGPAARASRGSGRAGRRVAWALLALAALGTGAWFASPEQTRRRVIKTLRLAVVGRKPGGTLVVESIPPGASVILDDEDIGTKTPVTMENLESEVTHKLTLRLAEDVVRTTTVSIAANQKRTLNVVFSEAVASVRVETRPADADVYVDDRAVALSPTSITLRADRSTKIKVEKAGYTTHSWTVEPTSGQALKLSHTFKRPADLQDTANEGAASAQSFDAGRRP